MARRRMMRRSRRRRRIFVRKTAFGRVSRRAALSSRKSRIQVHAYKRMGVIQTIAGNAAYAPYVSNLSPQFASLVTPGDFTTLYDQYKIDKVVYKVYLKVDPSAQTAATASFPRLYWYRDFDDTGAPSNLNEIRERANAKVAVMNPNRPVTIVTRPNLLNTLYSSAVVSNYEPVWGKWVDMSLTTTQYYALKFAIDDLTNTNYKVEIESIYYFQCRSPR